MPDAFWYALQCRFRNPAAGHELRMADPGSPRPVTRSDLVTFRMFSTRPSPAAYQRLLRAFEFLLSRTGAGLAGEDHARLREILGLNAGRG